jgi:hypothetical protein
VVLKGRIRWLEDKFSPDDSEALLVLVYAGVEGGGAKLTRRSERLLAEARERDPFVGVIRFHFHEMPAEIQAEEIAEEPGLARFLHPPVAAGDRWPA